MNQFKTPEGKKPLPVETLSTKPMSSEQKARIAARNPMPVRIPAHDSAQKTNLNIDKSKPMPVVTPTDKLDINKKVAETLAAGADKTMEIFDRADKMKPPPPPALHTVNVNDERGVEYFLKKAEALENQYKKTEVHVYDPDNKLIATLPTTNIEDGTDMTQGRTTLRNTLKGFLGRFKKLTLHVQPSGINYPDKKR